MEANRVPMLKVSNGLRLFTSLPEGFRAVKVRRPNPASVYSAGMYVVVDQAQTSLVDGADFAVIGITGPRFGYHELADISQVCRGFGGWCLAPGGGAHSQTAGVGTPIRLLDGPQRPEGLQRRIIGRVVGYLGDTWGRPLLDLWPEDFDQPCHAKAHQPADLPETYVCQTEGHCLAPHFQSGDKLQFSAVDPVEAGDYVALWLKPEHYHAGIAYQVMVKRLATPLPIGPFPLPEMPAPPIAIVEMDNPGKRMVVPLDRVMAIHKCRGVYTGTVHKVSQAQARTIAEGQKAAAGGAK